MIHVLGAAELAGIMLGAGFGWVGIRTGIRAAWRAWRRRRA
jgi:hypothetical protein